jgi:hypothetical protein
MKRAESRRALVVSAVTVVAVALPGLRLVVSAGAPDGLPLSTYPMFTRDPGRVVEVPTVLAIPPDGKAERLSPETIAGTDQVVQAGVTVGRAVRDGPESASELCHEVAGRVDGGGSVAVVVERHDAVAWAAGDHDPLDRRTVAECPVDP